MGATTTCVVRNTTTGNTRPNLGAAIKQAAAGQELTLKGTCPGGVVVRKGPTVRGIQPAGDGKPQLNGQGTVRHDLWVRPGVTLTLRNLTITGGAATGTSSPGDSGGGILNEGTLTLRNVTVKADSALRLGGGIRSSGQLALVNSQVRNNRVTATDLSGAGCGISASGAVRLRGTSSIHGNSPTGDGCDGGGIHLENTASLVMDDTSQVRDNSSGGSAGGGSWRTARRSRCASPRASTTTPPSPAAREVAPT